VNGRVASTSLVSDGQPLRSCPNGIARQRIDALDQAGVVVLLLQEGIKRPQPPALSTADDLIAGYEQGNHTRP
jgi:hypothetical protein